MRNQAELVLNWFLFLVKNSCSHSIDLARSPSTGHVFLNVDEQKMLKLQYFVFSN